jgi:hypothetical protein
MSTGTSAITKMLMFGCVAVSTLLASAAHADVDIDFTNRPHAYGVHGPKDYNAWLAKIACKRTDSTGKVMRQDLAALLEP